MDDALESGAIGLLVGIGGIRGGRGGCGVCM
jgi:hypothetical protein